MSNPNPHNQWKKGDIPNPTGRPREDNSWAGIIRRIGAEDLDGKTRKERAIAAVYQLIEQEAAKGNEANAHTLVKLVNYLSEREEGRPFQALQMTGGGEDGALKVEVSFKGPEGDDG